VPFLKKYKEMLIRNICFSDTQKHLTLNQMWMESEEDLPDVYSAINKISLILYVTIKSMARKVRVKFE